MQDASASRQRGSGGFTLIEVLVSTAVLALVGVALTAVSLTFVVQVNDAARVRQGDATTAQWSAMAFARDVQGASSVAAECDPAAKGTHLITLASSEDPADQVEYRYSISRPYELIRSVCPGGSRPPASRSVVDGLAQAPTVRCDAKACVPGSTPRTVTLAISRSDSFTFELDGVRRTTEGNSKSPPEVVPRFLALGGDTPLEISGSSRLEVVGNAFINRPAAGKYAVVFNGKAGLNVSEDFMLQSGAECSGCATNSNKQPGSYPEALPDPLRFVPEPDATGLTERSECPSQGGASVCQPGIYNVEFPPGGGGKQAFTLEPGTYVLNKGLKVTNGSLRGSGVLLYNAGGEMSINGGEIELSPQTKGAHAGILVFQARDNDAGMKINGNATVASLTGMIYAPSSLGVVLGGGGGTLRVGRVIATNLSTSGNGTVIVGGG